MHRRALTTLLGIVMLGGVLAGGATLAVLSWWPADGKAGTPAPPATVAPQPADTPTAVSDAPVTSSPAAEPTERSERSTRSEVQPVAAKLHGLIRILDADGHPVSGMQLRYERSGRRSEFVFHTPASDADGLVPVDGRELSTLRKNGAQSVGLAFPVLTVPELRTRVSIQPLASPAPTLRLPPLSSLRIKIQPPLPMQAGQARILLRPQITEQMRGDLNVSSHASSVDLADGTAHYPHVQPGISYVAHLHIPRISINATLTIPGPLHAGDERTETMFWAKNRRILSATLRGLPPKPPTQILLDLRYVAPDDAPETTTAWRSVIAVYEESTIFNIGPADAGLESIALRMFTPDGRHVSAWLRITARSDGLHNIGTVEFRRAEPLLAKRVVAPTGKPVPDAKIRVNGQISFESRGIHGARSSVRSDDDGMFWLPSFGAENSNSVHITRSGFADLRLSLTEARGLPQILLTPSATLRGTIRARPIDLKLGLTLTLDREDAKPGSSSRSHGNPNQDGIFAFADVTPGIYTLRIYRGRGKTLSTARPGLHLKPGNCLDLGIIDLR